MKLIKQAKVWEELNKYLERIYVKYAKNVKLAYEEFFKRKAFNEWGWVPGVPNYKPTEDKPELDDYEIDFLNDIKDSIQFHIDCRKDKRKSVNHEAEIEMNKFIREGLNYEDIPDNIKCDSLRQLHLHCLINQCEDVIRLADYVLGNGQ